jgi:hypothetical protein
MQTSFIVVNTKAIRNGLEYPSSNSWYSILQTYLFVADKKVVGCVVAVVIQEVSQICFNFPL